MNLNNEFDFMLIEFIYYATYYHPEVVLNLREEEKLDYKISSFLREVYNKNVLKKDEIKNLSSDYDIVKPLIKKIYDNLNFQDCVITTKVPKDDAFHILDNVEIEARSIIDKLITTFASFRTAASISVYTYDRIYDDFELLVKACNLINNKNITTDEEFCNEMGIMYYVDEFHWPI